MDFEPQDLGREKARTFAEKLVAPTVVARDRDALWVRPVFERLAAFLEFDGDESAFATSELLRGLGEGGQDAGMMLALTSHAIGCTLPVARFAVPARRRDVLPRLSTGEWIGALAHSETPREGNPLGLEATAVQRDGRWVLDGVKTNVVNAPVADVFVVTARTHASSGKRGVSAFLVGRDAPGLSIGPTFVTSGLRTATIATVVLDGCVVPQDHLLGSDGGGLTQVMSLVTRWQRALEPAPWVGLLSTLLDRSLAPVRERTLVGRPQAKSQQARARLADMKIQLELMRRVAQRSAWQLDNEGTELDIATARMFSGHAIAEVTRRALELRGNQGLATDSLPERLQRDATTLASLEPDTELLPSVVGGALVGLG